MNHFHKLALASLAAVGITVSGGVADAKPNKTTKVSRFDNMDVNNDGQLSLAEMESFHAKKKARRGKKGRKGHAGKYGKRGNKGLTPEQMKNKRQRRHKRGNKGMRNGKGKGRMTVAQRFAKLDLNSDGYISRLEMRQARAARKARHLKRRGKRTKARGVVIPPQPKVKPAVPPHRTQRRTIKKASSYTFSTSFATGFKLALF